MSVGSQFTVGDVVVITATIPRLKFAPYLAEIGQKGVVIESNNSAFGMRSVHLVIFVNGVSYWFDELELTKVDE